GAKYDSPDFNCPMRNVPGSPEGPLPGTLLLQGLVQFEVNYLIRLSPTARSTILSDVSPKLRRRLSRTEPLAVSTSVDWLFTQVAPAALRAVGSSRITSAVLGGSCTWASRVWVMKLRGLEFS